MATKAAISLEEHLRTSYEHEPEYVDGELEERPLGTKKHARLQRRLGAALERFQLPEIFTELTLRLGPSKTRIPDVCAFVEDPEGEHPSVPPYLVVEISSPDDRLSKVIGKLEEYRQFGVLHTWLIIPETEEFFVYANGGLTPVDSFQIPSIGLELGRRELFPKA
jgi:Uma2 family endonuclease